MTTDHLQLAIDTLRQVGTDRGAALADEIERGRARCSEQGGVLPREHTMSGRHRRRGWDAAWHALAVNVREVGYLVRGHAVAVTVGALFVLFLAI